jgi:UDP-N-acetylglucosamine--N-acetylmuramyl-(pentapeptide) pyrophosphoryl-undecaprenol N-acetylglucosamine transferase
MSDVIPAALELLSPDLLSRIDLVQQARGEDEARVRAVYERLEVKAQVASFFADLPQKIADAHLVIARAGASTVSELAVIGRPSILVPFPFALDQDQAANAEQLAQSGAAMVIPQDDFTPQRLALEIEAAFADPARLGARAASAKSAGIPDAAARLADLVLATMRQI